MAGFLETVGGVLLAPRRCVMPVAALLAITMAVAIGSSGIGHGDVIPSLTLAPALLVANAVSAAGRADVDHAATTSCLTTPETGDRILSRLTFAD